MLRKNKPSSVVKRSPLNNFQRGGRFEKVSNLYPLVKYYFLCRVCKEYLGKYGKTNILKEYALRNRRISCGRREKQDDFLIRLQGDVQLLK